MQSMPFGRERSEGEPSPISERSSLRGRGVESTIRRISAAQRVIASLSEALSLDRVTEIIVGDTVNALGARAGALHLRGADGATLVLARQRGLPEAIGAAIASISADAAHPIAAAAQSGEPLWHARADELGPRDGDLESIAVLPLVVGRRVTGVLTVAFDGAGHLPEVEHAFTTALLDPCAQALDRARLYEASLRVNARLELLARAGDILASSIDYDTTLENVARAAMPHLGDYCVLDVVEGGEIRRTVRAWDERAIASPAAARFPRAELSLPDHALVAGRHVLQAEADAAVLRALASSPEVEAELRDLGITSFISVPLVVREQTLGALTLCFGPSRRRHGADDLALADELARRAAVAVENATLHRAAKEANRLLEQANRAKDEFLGVVSHELRTPLNAILGWARLLRGERPSDPAVVAKGLAVIDRNARAQVKLIDDILDVSRIISGKLRLELRPLDLDHIVRASVEVIRPSAEAKGVELRVVTAAGATVSGDPDRLQQVVWNLLSNAIKFTPKGGSVEVRLEKRRRSAWIVVKDDGAGIDASFLPFVFERFRQADSSRTRRHGGLGLGLAIVRHLVELHGGTVSVTSEGANRGATFVVKLPLRKDEAASRSHTDTEPGPVIVRLDGLKVLVVDDEEDAREMVSTLLGISGAEVVTASNAAEATARLASFAPDVIVSDVGMPGEDGYSLIRRLRASGTPLARVPAVALTAYAGVEDARRAVLAGFHTHIPKPVEPLLLTATVASLAGRIST